MSSYDIWKTVNFEDLINIKKYDIDILPKGVTISTMCCSAKLGSEVDIENIYKYFVLDDNDILTVKKNSENFKSILLITKKNKRNISKKKSQKFYNQITIVIRIYESENKPEDINNEKRINIKLFKNGSIQMSGCKDISEVNRIINKLIFKLKEKKARKVKNNIEEIKFIKNQDDINVTDFKIDMINSNYKVNLEIDRSKLYRLLLKKKISASYEKCIRACVIIKFCPKSDNITEKEISIFVFQKGNVIITGAKSKLHISEAYEYLNNILIEHANEVSRKNEDDEEELLQNIYNQVLEENSHKINLIMSNN